MKKCKLAGVPELFCAPINYALQQKKFAAHQIALDFIEYGEGTGAMCRDLSLKKIDMAITLTEGIIKYQQHDPSVHIISQYVDTPLLWGIYVQKNSDFTSVHDLKNCRFAVSRLGSGSHLMATVLGTQQQWDINEMHFLPVGDINALGKNLVENKADVFLWEILTTSRYVEQYQLRLLSTIKTPWPCFQIAATDEISQDTALINAMCDVLFSAAHELNKNSDLAVSIIKQYYHLSQDQIIPWLKTVKWTEQKTVNPNLKNLVSTFL